MMTDEELESLASNIKSGNIKVNLVVRKKGDKNELIDGDKRVKAAKLLGWKEIPNELIDVRDYTDEQVRAYIRSSLTRGTRKDLVREAEVYLEDYNASGLGMAEYADRIGMNISKLSKILKRNNMPLPAKAFIQRNTISPTVLDEVLSVRPDYVFMMVQRAVEEKWSEAQAREAVKSGVTVDGKPVRGGADKGKPTDVNRLDMIERCAIGNILGNYSVHLTKIIALCKSKNSNITCGSFESLLKKNFEVKKKIDGVHMVYSPYKSEQTKKTNELTDWLASGTEDERRDKVERVNAKIKELIG